MTTDLALEYIRGRACELCYGKEYTIRFRHFVLQPHESRMIDGHNQFFILVEPYCLIRVESATAIFDLSEDKANELEYEHRGTIVLLNQSVFLNHARFIQVIPKICTPCP
ncbi:MAG: hypothetical protein J0H92_20940 [Sphingobacteriales bacterium]|nr:hypothetical protein [Sphingobacteriales bacterium]OJW35512.1 MAG: hypothetical protein BGO54_04175 [Sphingobacteriales bacterium 46-32]